ncbi:amidohydrolase [Alcaligenes faecalis subsp. faecalis NCIB 8687]|nr:amidohydrolase [Alcaligenes faecalis subsp. faecalis NCIB 8687]
MSGIDIEPGFGVPARHPDDPVYWPVYELARHLKVPVFLMSGSTTPEAPSITRQGRQVANVVSANAIQPRPATIFSTHKKTLARTLLTRVSEPEGC